MTVRALTFDVVGTLIDFETGLLDAARPSSSHDFLAAFGDAEGEQQRLTPEMPFPAMLDPISERLGLASSLRSSVVDWPAFDDAPAALAELGRRYRLVALTNADRAATAAMSSTLGDPFDDVVTAEDVGVNKPDQQMFVWCLGRLSAHGIGRDEVLHVAQSQFHDIATATRLGIATCWVERRRGRSGSGATPPSSITEPDLHVGTLAELAAALR
ncbi:HAD-IA family hydrolase [Pseudonocardia endophytica]|uniref:Putative hydrolase of the HAD superfamily n=1 Tax=Pseudonocardia endophytica TaxID=401976 RepID=A0A4R1HPF7_PSEEN|nr:HAD-IA family hydrolase [Pseudonocardia endophytica]TCK22545.1 putative hydrolase of the HAD superfamily [Pseudonocardia endophytica]